MGVATSLPSQKLQSYTVLHASIATCMVGNKILFENTLTDNFAFQKLLKESVDEEAWSSMPAVQNILGTKQIHHH